MALVVKQAGPAGAFRGVISGSTGWMIWYLQSVHDPLAVQVLAASSTGGRHKQIQMGLCSVETVQDVYIKYRRQDVACVIHVIRHAKGNRMLGQVKGVGPAGNLAIDGSHDTCVMCPGISSLQSRDVEAVDVIRPL
jgi:hypothetical protein